MVSILTRIAIAGFAVAASFAAVAPAQAGDVDIEFRQRDRYNRLHHAPIMILPPPHVVIVRPRHGRCNPEQALDKAHANGLDRVSIAHISKRKVTVKGRFHGQSARITFANVRGCPRL